MGRADLPYKLSIGFNELETGSAEGLAEAELMAFYKLYNIDRFKLEHLLQHFFSEALLDVKIADRFGKKVQPREWFVVPFPAIEEAIQRLMDGSILDFAYNTKTAQLTKK